MEEIRRGFCYLLVVLAITAIGPRSSSAAWDPLFRGAQLYDVGEWLPTSAYRNGGPHQLAAGDLNGDGLPDLVVVNRNDSIPPQYGRTVSVLLHSTDPSSHSAFLPKSNYPALLRPGQVELADMDLDGHLDAVVRSETDSLCVLLGTGSGSFEPPVAYPLGIENSPSFGRSLAVADVNQDGLPDVLAAGHIGAYPLRLGRVAVLLGTGGGALSSPALYESNPTPENDDEPSFGIAVGDLTGDGIPDVVSAYRLGAGLLQGNGSGGFTYVKDIVNTGFGLSRAVIMELSGDAFLDVVVGGEDIVVVLVGTGGANFSVAQQFTTQLPPFLDLGDMNLDGRPDLVVREFTGRDISIRLGTGSGTFNPPSFYRADHSLEGDFRLVDVDLNGRLDLVSAKPWPSQARNHTVSVVLDDGGIGLRTVVSSSPFSYFARHPAFADFDRNGTLDVAVAVSATNRIQIGLGNGDGTFVGSTDFVSQIAPGTIVAADLNRDGRADIVGQSGTDILLWQGWPGGGFFPWFRIDGYTLHSRSAADMNRDGLPDLVLVNSSEVRVFTQNHDGTLSANAPRFYGSGFRSLALGDWNRDGIHDVMVARSAGASLFLGNGDGTLGAGQSVGYAFHPYADLCAGDFNRDGKLDVALLESKAGQGGVRGIDVQLGNGAGGFLPFSSLPTLEQNGFRIETWDVNADGVPDLVASGMPDPCWDACEPDRRPSSVEVHLGYGAGQFGPPIAYSVGLFSEGVGATGPLFAAGDMNRDDRPDILSSHEGDFTFSDFGSGFNSLLAIPGENTGSVLGPRVDYPMTTATRRIAVGDLNRDGILDVVSASTSGPASVRLGTLQGALGLATTVSQSLAAWKIDLADVNRDGKLDLIQARTGLGPPETVTCMLGNGDGTFGPRIDNATVGIMDFAVGDMNRDGKPDLVVGRPDAAGSTVRILLGNGDGSFTAQAQTVSVPGIHDLELFDWGQNGVLDVVIAGGGLYVIPGNGIGGLGNMVAVDIGSNSLQALCVADFNRDGHMDVAATDLTFSVRVAWGALSPPFSGYLSSDTPGNVWDLQVGQPERDGRMFLYLSTMASKVVVMEPGVAPGIFTTVGTYDTGGDPEALALGDLDRDGSLDVFTANSSAGTISVFASPTGPVTGVAEAPVAPARARLDQNVPNPFNPETKIRFAVSEAGPVQLCVFDVQGRLVAKLLDGRVPAGEHSVRWDGRSMSGSPAASGVYYYRLRTSREGESRRMVLVK